MFSRLPLVNQVIKKFNNVDLSKTCIVGGQHILKTNHEMLQSLYTLGLKSKNIFLIGKCYSTNKLVYQRMKKEGIYVAPSSLLFEFHESFDYTYRKNCTLFSRWVTEKLNHINPERVIIFDDGGEIIQSINPKEILCSHIVGIEQTSSGFEKLRKLKLKIPVVNVARSWAKLNFESPVIGYCTIKKLKSKINFSKSSLENVLILGGGYIGLAIRDSLRNGLKLEPDIFDLDSEISNFREGTLEEIIPKYRFIIGCTGKTSLPHSMHYLLQPKTTLISASSSDREFDAHHLRKKCSISYRSCHHDILTKEKKLVNCGFPVNFDGGSHSVERKYIQLTRSLMVSALFQACELSMMDTGLRDLNINLQEEIIFSFLKNILSPDEFHYFGFSNSWFYLQDHAQSIS